ncbi:hypothetical protein T05_12323 [Trichinella murrelli]|uniref:Uncharacterized protein n=1 Tax=Trichinella murrelli TaxID=144512 RepID=A0A0V0U6T3_9BILA|nr:hypothetical protein T05_12323 [Trichinella murrelli]
MRYREESGGQDSISCFQSQLTDFPMYCLAEVEVAALYPRIREVALNRRLTPRTAALWSITDFPPDI